MTLNKVNLCWVLSDGRPGHEIQSLTLAHRISHQNSIQRFSIRQPWLTFAPRIIPAFKQGIHWQQIPDTDDMPDLIITTGRQAAAVGKFLKQTSLKTAKHIQILNPKDKLTNYDLTLVPAHDQISHPQAINFSGSLHPYDPNWFQNTATAKPSETFVAVVLGNPNKTYFKHNLTEELRKIRQLYPTAKIWVCGSPRLNPAAINRIRQQLPDEATAWFGSADGDNPYQTILRHAQHIFVTVDSINMMNECAASQSRVSLLAQQHIPSPKHRRFINSLADRWSDFSDDAPANYSVPYGPDQVLQHPLFQKLLNSPNSSSSG